MITTSVPGPWVVDNTLSKHWAILNTTTGRRKVVGPTGGRKVNYFYRAIELAEKRNKELLK